MRDTLKITEEVLTSSGRIPVSIYPGEEYLLFKMALEMLHEISLNNTCGKRTVLIVPVGPTGQYKYFTEMVNVNKVSLKNVWFFNMDEYMLDENTMIPSDNLLSFARFMNNEVYTKIEPDLVMPQNQRIFPMHGKEQETAELLQSLGNADVCFGGIGMNGHIAFNEPPEPGEEISDDMFKSLSVRVVKIARETIATNCMQALGGSLKGFPRYAATIGMKQILSAGKIRLYCFRDLHRAVVREAAFGDMSAACPVTLLQRHCDTHIYISENVAIIP